MSIAATVSPVADRSEGIAVAQLSSEAEVFVIHITRDDGALSVLDQTKPGSRTTGTNSSTRHQPNHHVAAY